VRKIVQAGADPKVRTIGEAKWRAERALWLMGIKQHGRKPRQYLQWAYWNLVSTKYQDCPRWK
jgi:hypothetical protein